MTIQAITTKIISTLGNKESLIPIMIKDGVDSTSLTYKSFKEGGPIEGMDRAIDEYGTQAIWIGGIPFFKKLIDITAYKYAKINPNVDPRIIADKEYSNWAKKNAQGLINNKGETVKDAISNCLKDGGTLAKNLFKGKIIAATTLTLITYFLMTKSKQKNTKNTVLSEIQSLKKTNNNFFNFKQSDEFDDIINFQNKDKSNISFGNMTKSLAEAVMFNPVHNMKIIDAGITTERIACSRNKTEFAEHTIKEGVFLFFVYGFGNIIEKGINDASSKFLNKPIDLKIDVLMDKTLEKALENRTIKDEISKMPISSSSLTDKLDFLKNNPENILIKAAKKSNIVKTIKDSTGSEVIDTSKYIDMKEIETLIEDLLNIDEKFASTKESAAKFLNKAKALKILSVAANIGISCFVLGYIIPKLIFKYREIKTGTTKFHVEEDIKRENKN